MVGPGLWAGEKPEPCLHPSDWAGRVGTDMPVHDARLLRKFS